MLTSYREKVPSRLTLKSCVPHSFDLLPNPPPYQRTKKRYKQPMNVDGLNLLRNGDSEIIKWYVYSATPIKWKQTLKDTSPEKREILLMAVTYLDQVKNRTLAENLISVIIRRY